jgi:hypothetical protein
MKYLFAVALLAASLSAPEDFPWWMAVIIVVADLAFEKFFSSAN